MDALLYTIACAVFASLGYMIGVSKGYRDGLDEASPKRRADGRFIKKD